MARKEDKLRPYRVDYFDIDEMRDYDQALVKSVLVRAVTADAAIANFVAYDNRVFIRAYRFYKNLTHKKDVYKAVEDLFSANKAVEIMERVEAYRQKATAPVAPVTADPTGHVTRFSDSSLYDEVCTKCGATDTSGELDQPCPAAAPQPATLTQLLAEVRNHPEGSPEQKAAIIKYLTALDAEPTEVITENLKALDAEPIEVITECLKALDVPTTGPDSPATVAVVADLQGMLAHDAHEQAMDTFKPAVPEGKRFPDPTNAPITDPTPVAGRAPTSWTFGLGDPIVEKPIEPDQAVGSEARPPLNIPMPDASHDEGMPLWGKLILFGSVLLLALSIIHYLRH